MGMIWDEEKFKLRVGRPPELDDLERCNCKDAGSLGHWSCGICEHDLPMFECFSCFIKMRNQSK